MPVIDDQFSKWEVCPHLEEFKQLDFRTVVCSKLLAVAVNFGHGESCVMHSKLQQNRFFVSWSPALCFKLSPLFSAEVGKPCCSFL